MEEDPACYKLSLGITRALLDVFVCFLSGSTHARHSVGSAHGHLQAAGQRIASIEGLDGVAHEADDGNLFRSVRQRQKSVVLRQRHGLSGGIKGAFVIFRVIESSHFLHAGEGVFKEAKPRGFRE